MKKTLIALMALASVTMAEEYPSWDLKVYTGSAGTNTTGDTLESGNRDFQFDSATALTTYAFDFTATKLDAYGYSNFTIFNTSRGNSDGSSRDGLGLLSTTSNSADSITVCLSVGTTAIETGNNRPTMTINEGDILTFAYDSGSGTVLLFNETSSTLLQSTVDLTGANVDPTKYYFESGAAPTSSANGNNGSSAVYTQGGKHVLTFGTITDLSSMTNNVDAIKAFIGVPSVPEPATATLSLLALAGLAARRRRK